jgi:hypothetical protein
MKNALIHASPQINNDINQGDDDLHGNQHNHNPLQLLAMAVAELVLQDGQQIRNDVEPFREQADSLVHLEIASHGLVYGFELWLYPEELGRVEDGAVEVNVDAEDEELADLHVDLRSGEGDFARQGDLGGDILAGFDSVVDKGFEE